MRPGYLPIPWCFPFDWSKTSLSYWRGKSRLTVRCCYGLHKPFAKLLCRGDFVLELDIDLVEADVGGAAGGEAAVGVERDALGRQVFEGRFDAGNDGFRRIDLAGLATYA